MYRLAVHTVGALVLGVGIAFNVMAAKHVTGWHPTKDARGVPLTVIVETVPKAAVPIRCRQINDGKVAACTHVGPQGCLVIMPYPAGGKDAEPSDWWHRVLGHEMQHCLRGFWHD